MPLILGTNSIKDTGYDVANSLRFDDGSSDYLTRTFGNGNRKTFTFSTWVKRSKLGGDQELIGRADGTDAGSNEFFILGDGRLGFGRWNDYILRTKRKLRDTSAWYHLVLRVDSTLSTADDRTRIYINGVQETDFEARTNMAQNYDFVINSNIAHLIGAIDYAGSVQRYFNGYMAEVVFCDGQSLDPTSFGEFDSDSNIWKPIDVSGLTFGTNGFYLNVPGVSTGQNANGLGGDSSGNGNHFASSGLSAEDQSTDTCTNNFATWNPLWSQSNGNIGDVVFSEGNLKTTTSANYRTYPATIGFSSGKWYWEIRRYEDIGNDDTHVGVMSELATPSNTATWIGSQANGWVFAGDGGATYTGGTDSNTGYSSAGNAGDIIQVAFNADDGKIYFGVNGTWQNSGNPATGTNPAYTGLDTSLFYFPCASTGSDVEGNFGSPPFSISSGNSDGNGYGNFEYAVPSGYYALNTKNLAEYG